MNKVCVICAKPSDTSICNNCDDQITIDNIAKEHENKAKMKKFASDKE